MVSFRSESCGTLLNVSGIEIITDYKKGDNIGWNIVYILQNVKSELEGAVGLVKSSIKVN